MNLKAKFKNFFMGNAFFYVTLDPERALGLEDILPNYTIICPFRSRLTNSLKQRGIAIFILEDHMGVGKIKNIIKRGSYGMLQMDLIRNYMNETSYSKAQNVNILVLKNSALIEAVCEREHWSLLAPEAKIVEKFENKITQFQALKDMVPYPESRISTIAEMYKNKKLTFPVILQFNRGHSGNSTLFIKSQEGIKEIYSAYPKREIKISKVIKGKTYTLNCLVLQKGQVLTGSISEQITGLPRATNNINTTVGNDYSSPWKFSRKNIEAVKKISVNTGKALYNAGYKGLFGIDVIIERDTQNVYFIEVNTHQPASIPFEAKLHRKLRKVPLMAYFILGIMNCKFQISTRDLPSIISPINARQVIYRNKSDKVINYASIYKKYKSKSLISRMKFIRPNEEIYRQQYIG